MLVKKGNFKPSRAVLAEALIYRQHKRAVRKHLAAGYKTWKKSNEIRKLFITH